MIVTRRIGLRIGLVLLVAVVLQVSFFSYITVFGASPNVISVVVAVLGLLGGAVIGAVCGFAAGLLLDSLLLQTLGISSLALLLVGYLAGRYRESFEIGGRAVAALLVGGLAALGAAAIAAIQLLLGVDAEVSIAFLREILVQGCFAALLAVALYPLIRRVLAPALVDYEPSGRSTLAGLGRRGGSARRRETAATTAEHGRRRLRRPPRRQRPVRGGVG
jgi:rod shape-determining protein MreD